MFTIPDQEVLAQYIGKTLKDVSQVVGEIYKMTCKTTGKNYVGQTVSHAKNRKKFRPAGFKRRVSAHFSEAKHEKRTFECTYLNNAIRKYGDDNFESELIMRCPREDMDAWEIHWIDKLESLSPNGFNLTIGGKVLIREKIEKEGTDKVFAKTPRNAPKTAEAIAKWSASSRAFYATPEGFKSMSDRVKKNRFEKNIKKYEDKILSAKNSDYIRNQRNKSTGELNGTIVYFSNKERVKYVKMSFAESQACAERFLNTLREHQATLSKDRETAKLTGNPQSLQHQGSTGNFDLASDNDRGYGNRMEDELEHLSLSEIGDPQPSS